MERTAYVNAEDDGGGHSPAVTRKHGNKNHIGTLLVFTLMLLPFVYVTVQAGEHNIKGNLKSHGVLEYTNDSGDSVLLDSSDLHYLADQIEVLPDAYYAKGYTDAQSNMKIEYVAFGIGTKTVRFENVKHGWISFSSQCQVGGGPGYRTSSNIQQSGHPGVRKQCEHDNALASTGYVEFDVTDNNPIWIQFYNTKYPDDTFSCVRALVVCDR